MNKKYYNWTEKRKNLLTFLELKEKLIINDIDKSLNEIEDKKRLITKAQKELEEKQKEIEKKKKQLKDYLNFYDFIEDKNIDFVGNIPYKEVKTEKNGDGMQLNGNGMDLDNEQHIKKGEKDNLNSWYNEFCQ